MVREFHTPSRVFCEHRRSVDIQDSRVSGTCIPIGTGARGVFRLLWGARMPDETSDESETESMQSMEYETTPMAVAYALLEQTFREDMTADSADAAHHVSGGAMQRLASCMGHCDVKSAVRVVEEDVTTRLQSKLPLLFVYDVVRCDEDFDSLRFVLDAERPPLSSATDFETKYKITPKLTFKLRTSRSHTEVNWWAGRY